MKKMKYRLMLFLLIYTGSLFSQNFVSISNNDFVLEGDSFYPVVMNYGVCFRTDNVTSWIVPYYDYGNTIDIECNNELDCLCTIKADFQLLKDLGFNTVRLFGISPFQMENGQLAYYAFTSNVAWNPNNKISVPLQSNYITHFNMISDILNVANEVGLKVIMLTRGPINEPASEPVYENYISALLTEFSDRETIFAYDFFNEPIFHDTAKLAKSEACQVVSLWRSLMDQYAPNHLLTIGFGYSDEIFRWDPTILPIDFVSFHPYGTVEEVGNELYYYSNYIDKPWIVGETGIAADDVQVPYSVQSDFAEYTLKRTINCGGKGYSWWQYQDVRWGEVNFKHNYIGLLNHLGETMTSVSGLIVKGSPKPAAQEFQNFATYSPDFQCDCLSSFYNYKGHSNFVISGRLLNAATNEPIAGGIIQGWDIDWENLTRTFSTADGSFLLYSDVPMKFYGFTAPGMISDDDIINYNEPSLILQNDTVQAGDELSFESRCIVLKPGYKVENGAEFLARPICDIGNIYLNQFECNTLRKKSQSGSADFACSDSEIEEILNIYPNPTKDFIIIELENLNAESIGEDGMFIDVYNMSGQNVLHVQTFDSSIKLDMSSFDAGLYFVKILSDSFQFTKQIIKE